MGNKENQIDIKTMSDLELWKLAYEQQVQATNLLSQLHIVQGNLAALQAELKDRENKNDHNPAS